MSTIGAALARARLAGVDRLDAQWLLAHHLQRDRSWLLAHTDAPLAADVADRFDSDCLRRAAGEPLAYVIGRWSFRGLSLQMSPAVLVPRPETELLVDWALELLAAAPATAAAPRVLDLGTGSGAIALSMVHAAPHAVVTASDASADALEVARRNGVALGLGVEWLQGDWWAPVGNRQFDLVLANPPYVAAGDPHLPALTHEPARALVSGPQGLDDLRHIVGGAASHQPAGGWLLLEHGHDQGEAVRALFDAAGYTASRTRDDLAGLPRCTAGRRS